MDKYIRVLRAIRERLQDSLANHPDPEHEDVESDVSSVLTNLEDIKKQWEDLDTEVNVSAERQRSGSCGRPKVYIIRSISSFYVN